jgi:predicted trehalose synthase
MQGDWERRRSQSPCIQKATRIESFLPTSKKELKVRLNVSMLDKAICEPGYETSTSQQWIRIPLEGIL